MEPGHADLQENIEVFQTSRPCPAIAAGKTLRVVDTVRFGCCIRWTAGRRRDEGVEAGGVCGLLCGRYDRWGGNGKIVFTFYWPGQDKWLGRNFEVDVV